MLKSILKIPFILLAAAGFAHAGPYYDLGIGTSSATMKLSGVMKVAASSASYNTPVITLDGAAAKATIPEVHSAKTGPIFSWETGGATQSAIQGLFDYGYVSGFTIYDYQNSANGRLGLGTPYGPQLYGRGGLLNPRLGLNTSGPKYALDVTGGAHFTSSATADAGFYGDGSHLTGTGDNLGTHIATKTITAGYGIEASTITTTQSIVTSSDVVAHAYYGDGSHLTGVSTSGGSISTAAYDGAPIGTFINYGSTIPPAGYLYCDGTNYSTTTYRDLFNVIGYNYSGFAVSSGPVFTCDFRGMFSRGLDTAKLRDSEYRVIGSTEADKMQGHYHWLSSNHLTHYLLNSNAGAQNYSTSVNGFTETDQVAEPKTDGTNGTPRTGPETRPMNIAVAVMVKYGNPLVVNLSTIAIANTTNTFTGANTFTGGITATQSIVTSSDVVAHAYYGDGSKLTGLAGGGDMVLAATQTVTAAKTFTSISNYPIWLKFSKSYSDFSTAALTNSITIFTLPAGGIVHAVKIKHSTAFAGTSITAYNVSVGITGTLAKYATAFDVLQAVSADTFQISNGLFSESHTATTDVKVTATSVGANLSAATQGSVDVWVLTSTAI